MAGMIPRPFIDDLLHRTDLVELIDGYVPLKKRGQSYLACCPFHQEKTPSFNVIAKKQFYHCFGCGVSGNAISFVMEYLHQSFTEAIETLADRLGLTVPHDKGPGKPQVSKDLYQLMGQVNQYYQRNLKQRGQVAIQYLQNRGLSGHIAQIYQLGYASPGWHDLEQNFRSQQQDLITTGMLIQKDDKSTYDRYRHRITFPIHDRHGRIIGFGGRSIDADQKPKYLNSPETPLFQKSKELYGLHQVISQNQEPDYLVIVEGYMDVIALAQHGVQQAVATLGTATSSYHIQLLAKYTDKLVFCFDGDNAGRQAAWRALESSLGYLNQGLDIRFMFLPEADDPDSLVRKEGREGFLNRMNQAQTFTQFLFDTLSQGISLHNPAGKTQLINAARPYIQKIGVGVYQELLIEQLSRQTHLDKIKIEQIINGNQPVSTIQSKPNAQVQRTPMRLAIALLLQNPELYPEIKPMLSQLKLNADEHLVLIQLLDCFAQQPNTTTAQLLEIFRDSEYFDSIIKLAGWDHQVPELQLKQELTDILRYFQKQHHESTIQQFLDKSRRQGLSEDERKKLLELLKEKHV